MGTRTWRGVDSQLSPFEAIPEASPLATGERLSHRQVLDLNSTEPSWGGILIHREAGQLPPAALTQSPPREIRPQWDDYPSAHPLKIHLPRDDQLPPGHADAIAPVRAPAAVGRPPIRPPSRDPPSAG